MPIPRHPPHVRHPARAGQELAVVGVRGGVGPVLVLVQDDVCLLRVDVRAGLDDAPVAPAGYPDVDELEVDACRYR